MANPIPLLETATHAAISDVLQADPFPISSIKDGRGSCGGNKKGISVAVGPHPSAILFQIFTQELIMATAKVKDEVSMIVGPRQ